MWPIFLRLVSMYFALSRVIGAKRGTLDTIVSPKPFSPWYFAGLFVISFMVRTPKSFKIDAPTPYSLESTGNPRSSFACTVSLPSSCRLYAISLCPKPIPRPSWPRKYTITPRPSAATFFIAISSWFPQSHRALRKMSPVRHSLCTLTSMFSPAAASALSPNTNATCSMPSTLDLYETAVKLPCSVGTRALAVRSTSTSRLRRYLTMSLIKTNFRSCFSANSFKSGSRAMLPSLSFTISHSTPAGPQPAMRAKSIAASVCPVLFKTPPSRYRRGNTCPGRTKSSATADGWPKRAIVAARSPALIPVFAVFKSTDTVNAVRMASSFSLLLTISGRFN
mmetsp:Transcript_2070/g.7130  ORF Transcript_2070/g.7130 Transcript_2070/m.7130 type:complete len:336 (-) Transcript_2070:636-1643(-)